MGLVLYMEPVRALPEPVPAGRRTAGMLVMCSAASPAGKQVGDSATAATAGNLLNTLIADKREAPAAARYSVPLMVECLQSQGGASH